MRIIVVSDPHPIENEAIILNTLFESGLELFHLRKPGYSENELIALIKKIDPKHYLKIVLHQYHGLSERFEINRFHFSESERLKVKKADLEKLKANGAVISTSVHSMSEYESLPDSFDYAFFGPVFESISKKGYKPQSNELIPLKKTENRKIKIIAIGGIAPDKIEKLEELNFDGAALLGAIWQDSNNAIKIFKRCNRSVNM